MEQGLVIEGLGLVTVERAKELENKGLKFKGQYTWELLDKDGKLKAKGVCNNGVADVGINLLLDTFFGSTAKGAGWLMGLIDSTSYTALSAADTMASHAGWTENTGYSSATRPAWTPAAASGKAVSNTSAVAFTMSGSATVKGFFLTSNSTKGGTTGTLWATALFATGDQAVVSSDILNVTYTISAA